jgi:hypothetical protein
MRLRLIEKRNNKNLSIIRNSPIRMANIYIEENKQRRPTTQINTKARANILQYIPAPKER